MFPRILFSIAAGSLLAGTTVAAGAEVAPGEYRCVAYLYGGNTFANKITATIQISGDQYQYEHILGDGPPSGSGDYAYDGSLKMKWTSGPLAGQRDADFEYDSITVRNRITLYTGSGPQLCYFAP